MTEQALNKEFQHYYNLLSKGQKESMLSMMKSFIENKEQDIDRISLEQYNKELEEAENRIDKGEFITHDALKDEARKW